jgi:hypothetical protein
LCLTWLCLLWTWLSSSPVLMNWLYYCWWRRCPPVKNKLLRFRYERLIDWDFRCGCMCVECLCWVIYWWGYGVSGGWLCTRLRYSVCVRLRYSVCVRVSCCHRDLVCWCVGFLKGFWESSRSSWRWLFVGNVFSCSWVRSQFQQNGKPSFISTAPTTLTPKVPPVKKLNPNAIVWRTRETQQAKSKSTFSPNAPVFSPLCLSVNR